MVGSDENPSVVLTGEAPLHEHSATTGADDAVLGWLPSVCVKDGSGLTTGFTFTQDVGGRTGLGWPGFCS